MDIFTQHNVILSIMIVIALFIMYMSYDYIFIQYHPTLIVCDSDGKCPDKYWCTQDKSANGDRICRPCTTCYEPGSSIPPGCPKDGVVIAEPGYYCNPDYKYSSNSDSFDFGDGPQEAKCPGYTPNGPPTNPATSSFCNTSCAGQGYCCPVNYQSKNCADDKSKGIIAQNCHCVQV
jgi:hypothetical protein